MLIALIAIAVAMGLAEIAVRALGLAPAFKSINLDESSSVYKRSENPILGFELKSNYRNANADLIETYPSTNAHGQRDRERSLTKPLGTKRIILLGDSVVEGHGIQELDDTLSRQLEMRLPDDRTEVLNFGVSGYCTLAEVELLRVKGLKFQPDMVVLVFVKNDFDNFNREAFELGSTTDRLALVDWLFGASDLFRLLCMKYNLFRFGAEVDPVSWNKRATGDNNVVEGLQQLAQIADQHNIELLIAIWPQFLDDRIINEPFMSDKRDELIIERLARAHDIRTVRLSEYFDEHRASIGGPVNPRLQYTLGDRLHPSLEGCRVAADSLKTILLRHQNNRAKHTAERSGKSSVLDTAAIEAARTRGSAEPNYARVYVNKGSKLAKTGVLEQAAELFERALESDSENVKALYNLGKIFQIRGNLIEAARHYERALQIDPDLAEAHNNLGHVLELQGKASESIDHYRQAIRIKPNDVKLYFNLAMALMVTRQYGDALKHFGKAVELAPHTVQPMNGMAWVLATHPDPNVRDPDEAIQLAQRVCVLTERGDASFLDTLAAAYAAAGQYELALTTANEALALIADEELSELAKQIRQRIKLYRQGRPYVEPQ